MQERQIKQFLEFIIYQKALEGAESAAGKRNGGRLIDKTEYVGDSSDVRPTCAHTSVADRGSRGGPKSQRRHLGQVGGRV